MARGLAPSLANRERMSPPGAAGPEQPMPPQGSLSPRTRRPTRRLLGRVTFLMYDDAVLPGVVKSLKGPRPVEDLAELVSNTVTRSVYHGLEEGQNVKPEMAMLAAAQISEDLGTNVARDAGMQPLSERTSSTCSCALPS